MNKIYILPINSNPYEFVKQKAAEKYNIDKSSIEIIKSKHGKPFLENLPDFHFNITHSGKLLVIAISDSLVGIDVEAKRKYSTNIIKRFHPQEIDYIKSQDSDNRFFEIWTKKEACLKYLGTGLSGGLDSFSVLSFSPTPKTYTFENYYISVCSNGEFEIINKIT